MAHENVIVIKKAGEKVSVAYLEKVVKKYTTYMGSALVYDKKMVVAKAKGLPTLAAINDIQDAFTDNLIVFTFGLCDKDIFEEDMQPFEVLKNDDKETIGIACLEGGFQGYSVVKSTHTDEWHCFQDFVSPKLGKLYKGADKKIAGLLEELQDKITHKDFSNSWTDRGNIALLMVEGEPVVFSSNNPDKAPYNWGWTSNALGHVEQTVAKEEKKIEPAPVDKPLTLLEKLKLKAKGGATVITAASTALPKEITDPPPTDTTLKVNPEAGEWVTPPRDRDTNQKKADWYITTVGYKPQKYKNGVAVFLTNARKAEVAAGTAKELKGSEILAAAAAATKHPSAGDAASPIDQPEPTQQPSSQSGEPLPMLSPRVKKSIADGWMKTPEVLKILGEDQSVVFDPKKMAEFENKFATFADHFGLGSMDKTFNWPYSMFLSLGKDHIEALAVLAFNLRNDLIKARLANPNAKIVTSDRRVAM